MNATVARLWADALRSGEFRQGREVLNQNDYYCCLGVLCEVAIANGIQVAKEGEFGGVFFYGGVEDVPPYSVREWSGLTDMEENKFIKMNDDENRTFDEIADEIERVIS